MRSMTQGRIERLRQYAAAGNWEACLEAMQYVPYRKRDKAFHAVSLDIYETIRQEQGYANHLGVLRGLAKTYYDGYLHREKAVPAVTKGEYARRSDMYFSRVLRQERNCFDLYQYGILLHEVSHDGFLRVSWKERQGKRHKAMNLFTEIIRSGQGDDKAQDLLLRACYRYSQCVIESLRCHGTMQEELDLLFPSEQKVMPAWERQHLRTAWQYLQWLHNSAKGNDLYQPGQVPYLLGTVADIGGQYQKRERADKAFLMAEEQYTAACTLAMKQAGKVASAGVQAYAALLTLALRRRNRSAYEDLLARYNEVFSLPLGTKLLHDARWHILSKDYGKARAVLMPYLFQAQAYPGLSLARARTLARIVDIGLGKKNPYSMGATPWQRQQYGRIAPLL